MRTLVDFHALIKNRKGVRKEFVADFAKPVTINIGLNKNHVFKDVTRLVFRTDYLSLRELREDYSHKRPRYPRIYITHIDFKEYNAEHYAKPSLLQLTDASQGNISFAGIGAISDELSAHVNPSCSANFGAEAKYDYLELMARETLQKSEPKKPYSSGKLNPELHVLISHVFVDTGENPTTLKMLTGGEQSHSITGGEISIVCVTTSEGVHHIQHQENSESATIITETKDGLVQARSFAPIITASGMKYVLHGEYREYKRGKNKELIPRAAIFFNEGTIMKDIAETSGEPLVVVANRAQNYDRQLVFDHFQNNKNTYDDDYKEGDPKSKFLMFN